jgi:uncharacterized protein YcfJ
MNKTLTKAALAFAAPGMLAGAVPAMAAPASHSPAAVATGVTTAHQYDRYDRYNRYERSYGSRYREEPIYRDTRVWRGRDGRYYCRRNDGTTGLLIGGAVGGLIGNGIAGRGDRTLGTILGLAGGALLGREIDRSSSNSRCR